MAKKTSKKKSSSKKTTKKTTAKKTTKKTGSKKKTSKKKTSKKKTAKRSTSNQGGDTHGTVDVSGALEELDNKGAMKEVDPKSFGDVPDGRYQVRIDKANLNKAQSSGRLQCSWELTIVGPDQQNRKLFKHDGLDNKDSRDYFAGGINRLGHEMPESFGLLPKFLEDNIVGTFAVVTVRTTPGSDFQNTYFVEQADESTIGVEGLPDSPDENEEGSWQVGHRCGKSIEGTMYFGEITEETEDGFTVTFDDGDVVVAISADDLVEETTQESEETPSQELTAEDVECDFTKLSAEMQKRVLGLAKQFEFDVDHYDDDEAGLINLFADIAEYMKLGGKYSSATKLYNAITKHMEDAGIELVPLEGDDEWQAGHRCIATYEGGEYPGQVESIDDEEVTVKCDDGDVITVSIGEIKEEE